MNHCYLAIIFFLVNLFVFLVIFGLTNKKGLSERNSAKSNFEPILIEKNGVLRYRLDELQLNQTENGKQQKKFLLCSALLIYIKRGSFVSQTKFMYNLQIVYLLQKTKKMFTENILCIPCSKFAFSFCSSCWGLCGNFSICIIILNSDTSALQQHIIQSRIAEEVRI